MRCLLTHTHTLAGSKVQGAVTGNVTLHHGAKFYTISSRCLKLMGALESQRGRVIISSIWGADLTSELLIEESKVTTDSGTKSRTDLIQWEFLHTLASFVKVMWRNPQ